MKRPQLVSQGSITRMLQAAEKAWKHKDFQQCIHVLERARRLDPANPDVLLQLASAFGNRYDYSAAKDCFEKAVRFASKKAETLASAAQVCRDFNNYGMAEGFLQRAVSYADDSPEILTKLAEIHERLRRLPEATELTDRALQKNGSYPSALILRAKLERQAGKLEEAENRLRPLLINSETVVRLLAWYELAAILDRQGRYDEAMSALLEAKGLVSRNAAPFAAQRQTVRKQLDDLRKRLAPEKLQRWLDCAPLLQPYRRLAVLCGHPRSGTTLLEQVLDSHPDIISAEETQIFHDDAFLPASHSLPSPTPLPTILESVEVNTLRQCRRNYFQCMERFLCSPVAGRLLIDKNPSLTPLIPVILRIFPEVKLLITLRDPRDVCLSCFMQPFFPIARTNSAYLSLGETVEEYGELMRMWTSLAPQLRHSSVEVRYEDMVHNLETEARRTLGFLNVIWDERVLHFDQHAQQKVVRSPTYADVTRPVFRTAVGRWRNYQKYFEPYLEKLAPFARAFGYE